MKLPRNILEIPLDGGATCLDFINTKVSWKEEDAFDYLEDYQAFLNFCLRQEIFKKETISNLQILAQKNPGLAIDVKQELVHLRHICFLIFSSIAADTKPEEAGILIFNKYLSEALSHVNLTFNRSEYQLNVVSGGLDLREPIWLIMQSAAKVLTLEKSSKIKKCPECGWIFLDRTKNNKQKWCNPLYCGTTTKARRYYQKKKHLK